MSMQSDRLTFCLSLIGFGAVLVLAPLVSHLYMANKHRDRAWGDSTGEFYFAWAAVGCFVVGAFLVFRGLRWARVAFMAEAPAPPSGASQALEATSSFRP